MEYFRDVRVSQRPVRYKAGTRSCFDHDILLSDGVMFGFYCTMIEQDTTAWGYEIGISRHYDRLVADLAHNAYHVTLHVLHLSQVFVISATCLSY